MTLEKLKDLVGASKVEGLVRDAAADAAREGDWEKLEEIIQFVRENGLNIKPLGTDSNSDTSSRLHQYGENVRVIKGY